MDHAMHRGHQKSSPISLNRLALSATIHCLTGCAIGEVLGMIVGMSLGWDTWSTIALSVALAFFFGYGLTLIPLMRSGMAVGSALLLAFASDTVSITIMEIIDNAVMLIIPGAMTAGPLSGLFWASMIASLILAGAAAYPVNRWLIKRGRGHAVVHSAHAHH